MSDAYAGFNRLYEAGRKGGPIIEAACWAHARCKFFDLARINQAPIAGEVVKRIDAQDLVFTPYADEIPRFWEMTYK